MGRFHGNRGRRAERAGGVPPLRGLGRTGCGGTLLFERPSSRTAGQARDLLPYPALQGGRISAQCGGGWQGHAFMSVGLLCLHQPGLFRMTARIFRRWRDDLSGSPAAAVTGKFVMTFRIGFLPLFRCKDRLGRVKYCKYALNAALQLFTFWAAGLSRGMCYDRNILAMSGEKLLEDMQ